MLIVQNQMPLHAIAIVRSWMLLAALRAAHELLTLISHGIRTHHNAIPTMIYVQWQSAYETVMNQHCCPEGGDNLCH